MSAERLGVMEWVRRRLSPVSTKNGETQIGTKPEYTADSVNKELLEIQQGLTRDSYGKPITPELAEQIRQTLPSVTSILNDGDITVVPASKIDSTSGRILTGLSIRRPSPADTAPSSSVLVVLNSTLQIDNIVGIRPGEPNQQISGPSGRDRNADVRLLNILTGALLASKKASS